MTLRILIEMKRCSQQAHSSAGWADSERCGCTELSKQLLVVAAGDHSCGQRRGIRQSHGKAAVI